MSYLLIGLAGTRVSAAERKWLAAAHVGGVVLFGRNIESPEQCQDLIAEIREIDAQALIAVDQEGGRVQRLTSPLTRLPPLATLGECFREDPDLALTQALSHGALMAREVRSLGFDLSFAPVLDINAGSEVIGDRAFDHDPRVVAELGRAYIKGMHLSGMAACGKHFPGHGSVVPDTHFEMAVDPRSLDEILAHDMRPFTRCAREGLDAVMMAHVVYPAIDDCAAGFSRVWIQEILRDRIGFDGVIFGDDLAMVAARSMGSLEAGLVATLDAGCDFALICPADDVARAFADISRWPEPIGDRRGDLAIHGESEPIAWADYRDSGDRQALQSVLGIEGQSS